MAGAFGDVQILVRARGMPKNALRTEGDYMNPKTYEYEAVIQKVPDIDGAYVVFPYDIKAEFGKGRVKVRATFDSEPYDGSIVNMGVKNDDGSVCYIIGLREDIRSKLKKGAGDTVHVTIKERE